MSQLRLSDVSDYGLGAVLLEGDRPEVFGSRTMAESGKRDSQTEKECLALVFGGTRFDHDLHGRAKITAVTDERLKKYHLNDVYKKGTRIYISDHLSRSTLPNRRMEKKERDDYEVPCRRTNHEREEEINRNNFHNFAGATLQKVVIANAQDGNVMTLADIMTNG